MAGKNYGNKLEEVSQWVIQTVNMCNCVKCTLPIEIENAGKEIGGGIENEIGGEIVGHSNCCV